MKFSKNIRTTTRSTKKIRPYSSN